MKSFEFLDAKPSLVLLVSDNVMHSVSVIRALISEFDPIFWQILVKGETLSQPITICSLKGILFLEHELKNSNFWLNKHEKIHFTPKF